MLPASWRVGGGQGGTGRDTEGSSGEGGPCAWRDEAKPDANAGRGQEMPTGLMRTNSGVHKQEGRNGARMKASGIPVSASTMREFKAPRAAADADSVATEALAHTAQGVAGGAGAGVGQGVGAEGDEDRTDGAGEVSGKRGRGSLGGLGQKRFKTSNPFARADHATGVASKFFGARPALSAGGAGSLVDESAGAGCERLLGSGGGDGLGRVVAGPGGGATGDEGGGGRAEGLGGGRWTVLRQREDVTGACGESDGEDKTDQQAVRNSIEVRLYVCMHAFMSVAMQSAALHPAVIEVCTYAHVGASREHKIMDICMGLGSIQTRIHTNTYLYTGPHICKCRSTTAAWCSSASGTACTRTRPADARAHGAGRHGAPQRL